MLKNWQRAGFGLYIHWPFCQSKCPYCDFNSHVSSNIDHDAWTKAYLSEISKNHCHSSEKILSLPSGQAKQSVQQNLAVRGKGALIEFSS